MTDEEVEKLAKELDVIVESVAQVKSAVSEDTPATSHPIPMANVYREDEVRPSLSQQQALSNAPDQAEGKFKVNAILDEE